MTKFWRFFISNGRGPMTCEPLGIQGHDVPLFESLARRYSLNQTSGVEIWRVEPASPAAKAGIREGDLLVGLAGRPTPDMDALHRLFPEGEPVEALLLRGDSRLERCVVPDPRPGAARRT
jgi:S1-C subfamily serine protease